VTQSPEIPFLDEMPDLQARLAGVETLYTDMDGTLLGRGASIVTDGEGRPTLETVAAVVALNAARLRVVMTSGRNARQLREASRLLGWTDFIGELGCVRSYDRGKRVVYDTGDWGPGSVLPGETPYDAIVRVGAVDLLRERFPGQIEYHDPWHLDREVTHVLRGNVPIAEAQAALDELPLRVRIIDNGIIHPPRHNLICTEIHAIHLVPAGSSKRHAIAADLLDKGLLREQTVAIGDSAADVEMGDVTGLMVCVRNGLDDPALLTRARGRAGIAATRATFGAGWAELAHAWLEAKAPPAG
jgi:hydroxymethylpyrimidine pyrophosphatase-like HAD family hydrolase